MKKKVLSMLITFAMLFSMLPATALAAEEWNGTDADISWHNDSDTEFTIDSAKQLAGLAKLVNEGTTFKDKTIKLGNNIDLEGKEWTPIGSMTVDHGSFKGVFDGDGHTISNLNVECAGQGLGLFAYTTGNAVIKNLTLNNVTVKSTDNSNYVGGVVGNSSASTKINNVHVTGNIDISGRGYIGGVSGHGYVVMDNVSVVGEGTISSTFWCAGGILGYAGEGVTNITNAKVEGTGDGLTITSAAGGLGAIVGMAEDNHGTQPISGSNLSAKNVDIKTYTGAYGDTYANYALGYLYGGNPTSKLTGTLAVENVNIETSSGETPEVNDAVASIDGAIYFDLQAAVDAADGKTVTLLRDVSISNMVNIEAGKTVTLDLAGYTISQTKAQTSAYQMILNDGNLTIVDSVGGGKISYIDSGNGGEYISDTIYNRGVLVIDGGTIENLSGATVATNGYPHAVDTYSGIRDTSVTIKDGTIYCAEYSAIRMFCVSATYKADLVINGGTIKGAVDMQNGTAAEALGALTINGGTFETTKNTNNIRFANWNPNATTYGITASIKGGSFNGGVSTTYVPDDANWDSKIITGGTFTASAVNNIDSNLLAQDFAFVENPDGSYGVVKLEPVAEVDGTQYTDLQAAIDVAHGKTVTLVNGLALTETVTISAGKTVTLDLNGKTISGTDTKAAGNFELIANRGTLTISDTAGTGKITLTAETDRNWNAYSAVIANLQGTLTVNGGTIEHLGGTDMAYGIDNNTNGNLGDATLTVNGGTIKSTYRAIRQFANSDSKTNTLTINGGTVSGDNRAVWLQSANEKANKAGMTITGTADVGSVYVWAPENGNASALTLSVAAANVEEVVDGIAANTDHGVVLSNGTYCVQETTVDVTGVTLDKSTASLYAGNSITLTATVAPENATINNVTWSSSDEAVATVDSTGKVTAVAAGTATVTATAGGQTAACTVTVTRASSGGGGSASYTITAEDTENGSVTVSPSRASSGSTVTITVEPDSGYELDELVVLDKNGKEIKLTQKSGSKYTFKMPSGKVTVEASFAKTSSSPVDSFLDVNTGAWYYDAVKYAVENGLMSGTGTYTFEPNTTLSRGMIAQMLYALEGKPSVSSANNFTDVSSSDWYDKAASWAQSKGIITGYEDGRFGPNDPLTREQLALILYNYAKSEGHSTSTKADLSKFADDTSTSPWAQQAMSWAVGEGLLSGRGVNMLYPTGTATRAEVAQIMMNFCENVAK